MMQQRWEKIREYTNQLINAMDNGEIDPRTVADMALAFMSEDNVKDMCLSNDLFIGADDTEDAEET